jgi:hypothetical protein
MDAAATPGAFWRLAFVTSLLGAGLPAQGSRPASAPAETPDDVRAGELLEQALKPVSSDAELDAATRTKAGDESVRLLRDLLARYPKCRQRGAAMYDVGLILSQWAGRYEDAIVELTKLVASDVDDTDPTGRLMSPFRNYRHHAWLEIASCQHELGKPGRAFEALAAAKRAYVTHCGTCQAEMVRSVTQRVIALAQEVAPGARQEEIAQAASDEAEVAAFLLKLGKLLADTRREADAARVLDCLVHGMPAAPEAALAAAIHERITPRPDTRPASRAATARRR